MPRREKTVFLIDGSAQLHRAYFAIRNLSTTRGLPTGATYGFTTMLRKLYQDEDPEWIGISFDLAGPTFRHQEYTEYKATRRKMDDDLRVQLPFVRRVCGVFGLPIVDSPGFEADDVIATLARQAVEQGLKVVVVSGDKDLLQMVDANGKVLNPGRDGAGAVWYDRATVEEKFGVPPERVVDVLALVGDAVDNVPGVPGIGEKGARDLVREYGPVEAVIENADKVKKATYREGLRANAEQALLPQRLATLRSDVPVALDLEALRRPPADRTAAHALFTELEFVALAREYAPEPATVGTAREVIRDEAALGAFVARARQADRLALSLVRSSREPMRARLSGVGMAIEPGHATYVPVAGAHLDATDALPAARVIDILRPLLEDERVAKLSPRGKLDYILLARAGITLRGLAFAALVAAYLLHPGRRTTAVEDLALEHLRQRPRPAGALLEAGAEGATLEAGAGAAA